MNCTKCGAKNEDGNSYCHSCGEKLALDPAVTAAPGVNCPQCGSVEPAGNEFCGKCGARLIQAEPICPQCGEKVPRGNKFCGKCGAAVQPEAAEIPRKPSGRSPALSRELEKDPLFLRLREIIADKLEKDASRITMNSNFRKHLDADSLDLYELVYSVEEELGMCIPDEVANKFETVSDAYNYIRSQQS
jgi:acyl carrier protein